MASASPAGVRRFVVRVLARSGWTAGLGVLVGDQAILTCAHVVNTALGRGLGEQGKPGEGDVIDVEFPLLSGVDWRGQGRVERWLPPDDEGAGDDIAGLVLITGLPEGAGPARLARSVRPGRVVDVFGYPSARPDGGWVEAETRRDVGGGRLQLDTTERAALHVQRGYSGSPVCDRRSGHVVGLLWKASLPARGERDSYAISAEQLRSAWPDMLGEGGRDAGAVTEDLFATDWAQLAGYVQTYDDYPAAPLIGREWLAAEIDTFCRTHDRGYFLVEGDAGMGKTAFAAWFARQKECAAHFAQLDADAGTTAVAVRDLGAQLIAAWGLDELLADDGLLPGEAGSAGWLRTVLRAAARRRDEVAPGTPIVLAVDALDAALETPEDHLPLGLPETAQLPGGVYAVATSRSGGLRYAPEESAALSLDPALEANLADLRQYLAWSADRDYIADAIASAGISPQQFTDLVLDRSLGLWIYVHMVLEQIRTKSRAVRELPELPRGLEGYYHNNLAKLCDGPQGASLYMPLLTTLAVAAEPVDAITLAALADIGDRWQVEGALDHALAPFCLIRRLPGEARRRFNLHSSLQEYVTGIRSAVTEAQETGVRAQIAPVRNLRERLALACREAQSRICDRYLVAWGGLNRHLADLEAQPELAGMDGGYGMRWLTWHLLIVGREADMHRLLACGRQGQNLWFAAHDHLGDIAGYLRDISRARDSAQRPGVQLRYAVIEASIASLSTTLPPGLLGELLTRKLWSPVRAVSYLERMTDEKRQAQALARIASCLPEELLSRALSIASRCQEVGNRATALRALIPHLHGDLLEPACEAVLDLMKSRADGSLEAMVAVAARLPQDLRDELARRQSWIWVWNRSGYFRAAGALFGTDDRLQGAWNALAEAQRPREIDREDQQGLLVAALLPHFPAEALGDVLTIAALSKMRHHGAPLTALAKHAPVERLNDVLAFASGRHLEPEFFRQAAPRLLPGQLSTALQLCQSMTDDKDKAEAFAALAPLIDTEQARRFLVPVKAGFLDRLAILKELDLHFDRPGFIVLSALLGRLPEQKARRVFSEQILPRLSDRDSARKFELPLFAHYLSTSLRRTALELLYKGLKWPGDAPKEHALPLRWFAPFSDKEIAEAFDRARANSWSRAHLTVADALSPHLTDSQLFIYAWPCVTVFPLEAECFAALAALGQYQPAGTRDRTCERGLAMAARINHGRSKARAVAALVPILGDAEPELNKISSRSFESGEYLLEHYSPPVIAFAILWSLDPYWGVRAMDEIADVLPVGLLAKVPDRIRGSIDPDPALDIPNILKRLADAGYTTIIDSLIPRPVGRWHHDQCERISRLAPILSPAQARSAWHLGVPGDCGRYDAEALSALVSRLPERERAAAVDEVLTACTPRSRWGDSEARVLGRLARAASTERLIDILREYQSRREPGTLTDQVLAELAPGLPEALIDSAFQFALSDDYDSSRALAKLAPRLSGSLLMQAITHVSAKERLQGKAAALTALARQLPPQEHEMRSTLLSMALEAAISGPLQSKLDGVMRDLIPQLPEQLRARCIEAAINEVCSDLHYHEQTHGEPFDRLHALIAVLRGTELEQLYARLEEIKVPRVRAHAQAAVLRQATGAHTTTFYTHGEPLHHHWPGDLDRAALLDLIAAAAWWVDKTGHEADVEEVIEAIFDVARWWP